MAIDFSKYTIGDTIYVHCCDDCVRRQWIRPKRPADSGSSSWYCEVCHHFNIGSSMHCIIGDWLSLKIIDINNS
jgi:hypothetical protein